MTTPRYFTRRRMYTSYADKYRALLAQGFTESEAARMAANIPQVYGPERL